MNTTPDPLPVYNRNPRYPAPGGTVRTGWQAPAADLAGRAAERPVVVAVDGPPSLDWDRLAEGLGAALTALGVPSDRLDVRARYADWSTVASRTGESGPYAADPYFLPLAENPLSDLFDAVPQPPRPERGVLLVHGPGAAAVEHDVLWYADVPKRYAESAIAGHGGANLGQRPDAAEPATLRRLFYVDWPMLDRHRDALAPRVDRWLDLQDPARPASLDGAALRAALAELARRPVRARPFFNSTPWGGHWGEEKLGFPASMKNTALGYELIAPEAGVLLGDGPEAQVEVPFQLLCVLHPEEFLGADVHARFGTSFPIRFDYLDTVGGGNLSVHCHPKEQYMRERFGWRYTQHETYYLTEAGADATVFLGLQEDADTEQFRKQVVAAVEEGREMDPSDFVQPHRAEEGQLYLIPAGTPHASGAGNLVLEVSATPYLYSLRFYDWLRVDAEGNPRPLPYEHAFANLETERRGEAVRTELIQEPRTLREGEGWREELVGALDEMFYEVRRFTVEPGAAAEDDTAGRFHILNVSKGAGAVVETADGHRHVLAFAETLTVPAAVASYRISALGDAPVHVVKSLVRP